jgi:hypothetical protein
VIAVDLCRVLDQLVFEVVSDAGRGLLDAARVTEGLKLQVALISRAGMSR